MEKLQLISDRQVDSVDLNYEEVRSQELLMKRGAGQIPRLDRNAEFIESTAFNPFSGGAFAKETTGWIGAWNQLVPVQDV